MEDQLPPTPLGFKSYRFFHDQPDIALSRAYAQGDCRLAESLMNRVSLRIKLEYLFDTGQHEACAAAIAPAIEQVRFTDNLSLPNFTLSTKPFKALAFTAFIRKIENRWLPPDSQHADNLLKNLPQGAQPLEVRSRPPKLWIMSPASGYVLVYFQSLEHELCVATWTGVKLSLALIEPFSGRVPPGLLAEALFSAGHVSTFEQVVLKFPSECRSYILGLSPHLLGSSEVERLQAHLHSVLLRQAAREALA